MTAATPLPLAPKVPHDVLVSLLNKAPYREKWMRHVQRRRGSAINQRAVATFIAYELTDKLGQDVDPTTLKDRVARALNGEALSDATAQLFITAFDFTSAEARELQRAISIYSLGRKLAQRAETTGDPTDRMIDSRHYTSLSTLMEGNVDSFGYMRSFTVTEMIRSEIDGLTRICPRFETTDAQVTILDGGALVSMDEHHHKMAHHDHNTMWQLVIEPPYPLRAGALHHIRYRIDLDIRPLLAAYDPYNYASLGPFTPARFNLSLTLTFDRPPAEMHQKIWSTSMQDENLLEVIHLPAQTYYSMTFPIAEHTIFSYFWATDYQGALDHYQVKGVAANSLQESPNDQTVNNHSGQGATPHA